MFTPIVRLLVSCFFGSVRLRSSPVAAQVRESATDERRRFPGRAPSDLGANGMIQVHEAILRTPWLGQPDL
jgi:hypothetical protein